MKDRLLEVSTVAKRLNVAPGTIRNMLRDPTNPLQGVKLGRNIRVYSSSVEKLLKAGEENLLDL